MGGGGGPSLVNVLCQLQLRIANTGNSSVYRGEQVEVTREGTQVCETVVIKSMMLSDNEEEKMAANKTRLLRLLGNHDRIVHLRAAFVEANLRHKATVWTRVILVFESCCMTVRDFMLSQGQVSQGWQDLIVQQVLGRDFKLHLLCIGT